jgi:hypothetical protein
LNRYIAPAPQAPPHSLILQRRWWWSKKLHSAHSAATQTPLSPHLPWAVEHQVVIVTVPVQLLAQPLFQVVLQVLHAVQQAPAATFLTTK